MNLLAKSRNSRKVFKPDNWQSLTKSLRNKLSILDSWLVFDADAGVHPSRKQAEGIAHRSNTGGKCLVTSCVSFVRTEKNLKEIFAHPLSLRSWSLHIKERRNKHLEDRIGKQRNLANSIFIDRPVKAATLASVLVYVPVGSHVSLNDTTGWRRISDKLKLPVPGDNSGFAAGLHAKTMRISLDVTFSADAFFFAFRKKCGSPEQVQARMKGKSMKSETFRSFSWKKNTDTMPDWRWRKWPFQRNAQKTHRTVFSCTAQTLTNFGSYTFFYASLTMLLMINTTNVLVLVDNIGLACWNWYITT